MQTEINIQVETGEEKRNGQTKRTVVAILLILIAIPATIYLGWRFADRQYYITSLLIIFYTMIPFFLVFEKRKPQARELVVIAVLCVIAVASRAAFIWAPHFKPITAIIIIAGMAFGAEAGFLTGAVSGFVSNFIFGQGPWTPWQMFAFGIAGFLAGLLHRKGFLKKKRLSLCIFGGFVVMLIVGPSLGYLRAVYYELGDHQRNRGAHIPLRPAGQRRSCGGYRADAVAGFRTHVR